MNTALSLSPVSFHDHTLFLVSVNDEPFTPMKPIVEGMGLAWQAQHRKLVANKDRFCVTIMVIQMPGDDQARETLCMPVRKLPAFFSTVNPGKVAPEIRDRIIMYQNECDDALWDYWTKGQATRHSAAQSPVLSPFISPAQQRHLHDIMDAKVSTLPKGIVGRAKAEGWTRFNRHFRVARYSQLPTAQFDAGLDYLIGMEFRLKVVESAPAPALPAPAPAPEPLRTRCSLSFERRGLSAMVEQYRTSTGAPKADIYRMVSDHFGLPTIKSMPVAKVSLAEAFMREKLAGLGMAPTQPEQPATTGASAKDSRAEKIRAIGAAGAELIAMVRRQLEACNAPKEDVEFASDRIMRKIVCDIAVIMRHEQPA